MAHNNDAIIDRAFKEFENKIHDTVRKHLSEWCKELVSAAVRMRLGDPKAHNFTGNLLNSIVVCLYENRNPIQAFYAAEQGNVKSAIMHKMTARKRPYSFYRTGDYEGKQSKYTATIPTDEGFGIEDAKEFFSSFRPEGRNMFDVVVAYTVEYADWVQLQRNTTGFLESLAYAKKTGMTFMTFKSA